MWIHGIHAIDTIWPLNSIPKPTHTKQRGANIRYPCTLVSAQQISEFYFYKLGMWLNLMDHHFDRDGLRTW